MHTEMGAGWIASGQLAWGALRPFGLVAAAGLIVDAAERDVSDAVAAASVTAAEVRVLRYLPTKMTFAVIADRLGISRSAAKDRAERAYRKLGVHSRADAVTRARELGLIPKSTS